MSAIEKALVVGGGIGGLTAAIALSQKGIKVELIEARPDLSVYGVGIIQPNNTLRALGKIGLAQACIAAGAPFPGWRIFDAAGHVVMDLPGKNTAAPDCPPVNGITRPPFGKARIFAWATRSTLLTTTEGRSRCASPPASSTDTI